MKPAIKSEMLVLAREARGLTQSELAVAISLSQGTLSKYESGLLNVSEEDLGKLATVLDLPMTFFALPGERRGFGTSCTYHRKRTTMPSKELNHLLAQLNMHRVRIEQLLRNVDIEHENQFPNWNLEDFGGDVARVAQALRNYWKLPPGPIQNMARTVENVGGIIIRAPFNTRKLDAICQWARGMPPFFFVNADSPGDRLRFTLAHEIGHLILHQTDWSGDKDMEREAQQFASEFLMPAHDIAADLGQDRLTLADLARLKTYWKTSMQSILFHAYDLGKITDRHKRSLWAQISTRNYRLVEPIPIPPEESTLLAELFDTHLTALDYTVEDLSQLIGAYPHEIRTTYLSTKHKLRLVS